MCRCRITSNPHDVAGTAGGNSSHTGRSDAAEGVAAMMRNSGNDLHTEDCPYCGTTIVAGSDTTMMAELMSHWLKERPEELEQIEGLLEEFVDDE